MLPLYDREAELVGWLDPAGHFYDLHMEWVAYLVEGSAWSVSDDRWLGPVTGTTVMDSRGSVVAWNPATAPDGIGGPTRPQRPQRAIRPLRPERPLVPERPLLPERPLQGWSELDFDGWLRQ